MMAERMPPRVYVTITSARNNRLKLLGGKAWIDKGGPLGLSTHMERAWATPATGLLPCGRMGTGVASC